MYFIFPFMSLSSKNKKNNRKNSNEQDQRGDFIEKQDVYQNNIKWTGQHTQFIISLSHSHRLSLSLKLKFLQWSLSHSSLLYPMMALKRPISHHSENPYRKPNQLPKSKTQEQNLRRCIPLLFFFFFLFAFVLWV